MMAETFAARRSLARTVTGAPPRTVAKNIEGVPLAQAEGKLAVIVTLQGARNRVSRR
jgi:hypothetical protein